MVEKFFLVQIVVGDAIDNQSSSKKKPKNLTPFFQFRIFKSELLLKSP